MAAWGALLLIEPITRLRVSHGSKSFVNHRGCPAGFTDAIVNCLHFGWHLRWHSHRGLLLLILVHSIVCILVHWGRWLHLTEEIGIVLHRVHFIRRLWIYSIVFILDFIVTVISIQSGL
jgi:hypothetical protein